jgi:lipoprotein-releasing system permease protein
MIKNFIKTNSWFQSPWTVWVGLRYLKSKKNSRFLSFITLLSVIGVALGVTSMIVVLSVMDGFESELKKRMISSNLHILVQPSAETQGYRAGFVSGQILGDDDIKTIVSHSQGQIENFWPVVSTEAILKSGKKVTGAIFKGVTADRIKHLSSQLVESAEPHMLMDKSHGDTARIPGVFVGQELAYELALIPGDQVTMISPTEVEGPVEGIPRLKRYVIEGVYHSGLPDQELHTIFARDTDVRSFLRKANVVSQWEVTVADFNRAPEVARQMRSALPTFRVQDWMQMNAHLFESLKLERMSMFVILAFITIVASFNIVTTLTLMVLEKKKEISILKAMGAQNSQVASIFMSEGILIGALGVSSGALLGFIICSILRRYEFITLPDIYYDRTLPVTFNVSYYVTVCTCSLIIVLLACVYPSRRAARVNPLDGIRFG